MTATKTQNLSSTRSWLERYLYLGVFFCWMVIKTLCDTTFSLGSIWFGDYQALFDLTASGLLALRICLFYGKLTKQERIALFGMSAVFFTAYCISGYSIIFAAWMFIAAAKEQDTDELVAAAAATLCFICLTVFSLCAIGKIKDAAFTDERASRRSLGFGHPNTLGVVVQQLVCCWLYLRRNRLKLWDLAVPLAAAVFCYIVPNSLTSVGCCVLLMGLAGCTMLAPRLPEKASTAFFWVCIAVAVFANLASVATSIFYNGDYAFWTKLSAVLSSRPRFANRIYNVYGISLFGRQLAEMFNLEAEYNGVIFPMPWLDSSYMNLLLRFGLMSYLCYSTLYIRAMVNLRRTGDVMLMGILAIYAIHGFMEMSLYQMIYNVFLPCMAAGLYGIRARAAAPTGKP